MPVHDLLKAEGILNDFYDNRNKKPIFIQNIWYTTQVGNAS